MSFVYFRVCDEMLKAENVLALTIVIKYCSFLTCVIRKSFLLFLYYFF